MPPQHYRLMTPSCILECLPSGISSNYLRTLRVFPSSFRCWAAKISKCLSCLGPNKELPVEVPLVGSSLDSASGLGRDEDQPDLLVSACSFLEGGFPEVGVPPDPRKKLLDPSDREVGGLRDCRLAVDDELRFVMLVRIV
jgi:hypothetical protein